jgi:hypothetical protein
MPPKLSSAKNVREKQEKDAADLLWREYETMRSLFMHTENSAQNIFNFYLTLITTVIGGIVLLSQYGGVSITRQTLAMSLLMAFAAGVGIVYISAISGRYAHMTRYANGIDEIRRYMMNSLGGNLPPIYMTFISKPPKKRAVSWVRWLFPTGTYELFIAVVNSLSISLSIWFFLSAFQVTDIQLFKSILTVGIIFFVSFLIFNIYSNYIIQTLIKHLNVQIDASKDFDLTSGKF